MKRVYYVLDRLDNYYIINCATYGFEDDEEIMSSSNDIIYKGDDLLIGQYVHFDNEHIDKSADKYIVSGKAVLLKNDITDEDRKQYDEEFDLSIKAYADNNLEAIKRWEDYLKSYEEKFLKFEIIQKEQVIN